MPMPPCILRAHRVRQALTQVSTRVSARHAQATHRTTTQSRQVSLRVFAMLDGLESQQTGASSAPQGTSRAKMGAQRVKSVEAIATRMITPALNVSATKDLHQQ